MRPAFRILGPIEVDGAGRVPRGRPLSLLALLLVHRGTVVQAERAVDELWQGSGPRHAKKAVHVVASRLRAALGDGVLRSEAGGYALRLEPGELDADRFEALARRGRAELADGESREAAATLRQALALWRGPALADVREQGFAQPEIARLGELHVECLCDRIDADLACGRQTEVAGELEALVREHPLRERLRGQQMLALYRAGRQAEALEAYRCAYEALVDGLGIEPSPHLRALEAAILRHEVPAPPAPRAREPLAADARRLVTCAFVQLAGPPAADPESMRAALERFHAAVGAICETHGGAVAETRADAVLAVFGTNDDDAQRALRAATELVRRKPPHARCGVGTGEIVAATGGNLVGEAVAAAERLARAAAPGEIRIDDRTWRAVRHAAQATGLPSGGFVLGEVDAGAPAIRRQLDRPLVGREAELARLRDTFDRVAASGAAELLAIVGEPGIGKSRLAAELPRIAGERGRVLAGRCPAYGEGITYWPLREVVEQARREGALAALGIPRSAAHQVEAAVGLRHGGAVEDTGWAFLQLIGALARTQPLILAIDDAHLAEPALLDLLGDVVARLRDAPALIVWVARLDLLERRHPVWLRRLRAGAALTLGPLAPTASATLLDAVAGGRLEPEGRRRVADAAGGNPLFLEQLVAHLDEREAGEELPPALHALLAARLDRLDATERSVLALGAVVGDAFEPGAVHALAGLARAELEQACERLVERELLVSGGELVRFRHGLVRDVAYGSLAKAARARLHERHAAWLDERDVPEADARIGFHLETAWRYERELDGEGTERLAAAAGWRLAAAGRGARARGDLPGELGFLERAVVLLGDDGAELLPALASALIEAGASARAEALARQAVSAGARLRLPRLAALAAIERERVRLHRQPDRFDVPAAVGVVERASRALRAHGDELGLARADFLMADLTWMMGDLEASYAHAERMLAHACRAESGFDVAAGLIFATYCLAEGPFPMPDAIARLDALAGRVAGLHVAEVTFGGCRAVLETIAGRNEVEAGGGIAEARAGLGEFRLSGITLYFALLADLAALQAGDPAEAERAARDAEAMVTDPGDGWLLSMIQTDLALAVLAQKRLDSAVAEVARIDERPAPCDADWVIRRHTARAQLAALRGEPERGLDDARAGLAAAEGTTLSLSRARAHRTLAALLAAIGDEEGAAAAVRREVAILEAKGSVTRASSPPRVARGAGSPSRAPAAAASARRPAR